MLAKSSTAIVPADLPLITLAQNDIDQIIATVPGGVTNIADIYALSPLQEGMLFHHRLTAAGDAYVLSRQRAFHDRPLLERYLDAMRRMVERHDVLRTAFVWDGLSVPAQVVWRTAPLSVTELELDGETAASTQLSARFDPRRYRMDLTAAPLLRFAIAHDAKNDRWLLVEICHHLIADETSLQILERDATALLTGDVDALADPRPFRELVARSREGAMAADHERFFRRLLGEIEDPSIPFGLSEVHGDGRGIGQASRMLSSPVDGQLRAHAQRLGVTMASLCHLAWGQVVARTSGRETVVFGTVLSGRDTSTRDAMGLYMNTLPIRLDLGERGVEDSVREIHTTLVELSGHPHASLALAQRCSGVAAPAPLFSALLNYRERDIDGIALRRHVVAGMERLGAEELTNYPFVLSVDDSGDTLELTAQVIEPLSPASACGYMARALEHLASLLAHAPATRTRYLDILPEAERRQLVIEWNDTARAYPTTAHIHEQFEQQARRSPDAIALVCEGKVLTYRELNARANQLARELQRLGVGVETRVGVAMERSIEMVVSLYAVLKAGGAYVPFDPGYPLDRLAYMMSDARTAVVLIHGRLRATLPRHEGQTVVAVDERWTEIAKHDASNLGIALEGGNLAYVIYTSGSTGRPKGAMNTHAGIANRLQWMQEQYQLGAADRVLQKTPFSFDVSVWEFFWPLMVGARLVVARPGGHQDPRYLVETIAREGITTIHFVPPMLAVFLDDDVGRCTSLRAVMSSGEALPYELVVRFHERLHARLHNLYGPTEAAVDVSHWTCETGGPPVVPIGHPIANLRLHVLDAHHQPVPRGAAGEIHIAGIGVGRGYLDRPALTAERFVPDPFSPAPGGRLYKTGDLGRVRADGAIEYLGRIDHQVKLRGFRIELGEIEAQIAQHVGVREVVVLVREDTPGDKRLAAYVVSGGALDVNDLRAGLEAKLPEYMVPSAFVVVDALPLTPNGKIDRKALPAPERVASESYTAPRTPAEVAMAAIWAEVIGVERIGIHDDFFEIGGQSLHATQVVSRLRRMFEIELPLRTLFEAPTIAGFIAKIEASGHTLARRGSNEMHRIARDGEMPLSFAEERQWFLEQLEPGSPLYNIELTLQLDGALDIELLIRGIEALVQRHESLRTTFELRDDRCVRVIAPSLSLSVPIIDLAGLGEIDRNAEVQRLAADNARRSFDLQRGPLLRISMLRLAPSSHVMLFTIHHIVFDGWSLGVFWHELAELYRAYSTHTSPALRPLAVDYADFATWQRAWLSGPVLEEQVAYWKRQLAGMPSLLELPTDRPRQPVQRFKGKTRWFELSAELTAALEAQNRDASVTLFMTLLAAFQVLLHRYSRQDDVAVGSPVANRNREETEGLIGFFVNTLVLRADLSGDPTFRELLTRVREMAFGAFAHQDLPLGKLLEEINPERNLSYTPLFQVLLVFQNAHTADGIPGVEQKYLTVDTGTSKLDLTLAIFPRGDGGLDAMFEYSTDLFDDETIARMIGHFEQLLESIVARPDQRISALPILTRAERQQLVVAWNRTERDYATGACVHEIFERHAVATPERTAVTFERESLSYAALNARANQLAHHLQQHGVGVGTLVGVAMERSSEMVVSLLAVLKAGAAYVPLDPGYPRDRLELMIRDARPRVVLIQEQLRSRFVFDSVPVIAVDSEGPEIARHSSHDLGVPMSPDHLVYVIYTSGSTGRPKGVMNTHAGAVNHLAWLAEQFDFGPDDSILQKTPFSFDASVWEIFLPLAHGARVVMAKPDGHQDPAYMAELVRSEAITTLQFVPAMLAVFVDTDGIEQCTSVRRVVAGGEALPVTTAQRFRARFGAELYNMYGQTEASDDSSYWRCTGDELDIVPIGRPIGNMRVYVLDPGLEPVPIGVAGEIHIAGAGIARGYLDRPALTAERFVPDPYSNEPGGRLYKTGDLGRVRADGVIEFVGRVDHQVKVRGFRIELGEIEAVLAQHESLRDVAAIVREDVRGDKRVVAYIVGSSTPPSEAQLRAHLIGRLPEYMIPSAFVVLDALPLTPNGKVDRKALPAPAYTAPDRQRLAPRTPTEDLLVGIWTKILGLEHISIDDNFFALGGHSLLATLVVSRARAAFRVELPIRALFEAPTIASFAAKIETIARGESARPASPIELVSRDGDLPLSFAEDSQWFLERLDPGSALYNVPLAIELTGSLDVPALERGFDELVQRHEVLRTTYGMRDEHRVRAIAPCLALSIPVIDLSALDEPARMAKLHLLAAEEARHSFDLARGPLVRVTLIRLGARAHVMLFTAHHILLDDWSTGVLWRELAELYRAGVTNVEPALAPLPIQYADYAAWQRAWLSGPVIEAQLDYWRHQLAGIPRLLELPTDRPRPLVQRFRGAMRSFQLSRELTTSLERLAISESATLFMTLLAAFQVLLARHSRQDDIVIGSPVANRSREETEGLIGFFVNTVVLRADVSGDPTFRELLARVREVALGAYGHQDIPFDQLVEALNPTRSLSFAPLFQVAFVLQGASDPLAFAGLESQVIALESSGTAKFDLTLFMEQREGGLGGTFEYDTDLFDDTTIARLIGHLERLLEGIVAQPQQPLSTLPILGEAERHKLVVRWNDTTRAYPRDTSVHELFERQVDRAPDTSALVFGDHVLTYAELDTRANQVAHRLRALGVGPDVLVGICVERSLEMVIGLLGILKAGGAYVPLDPAYPAARLAFMMEDAAVTVLLTQQRLIGVLPAHSAQVVCLDTEAVELAREPSTRVASTSRAEHIAYVDFTSGSTGRPKGACIPHRAVVRLVVGTNYLEIRPDDVFLQLSPIAFDASTLELWGPLLNGAKLVIMPPHAPSLDELGRVIVDQRVTVLWLTAGLFHQMVDYQLDDLRHLRCLLAGGDVLSVAHVRRVLERLPCTLINGYGPTENTTFTCCYLVPRESNLGASVPIGRPIAGTTVYVLDARAQPVPIGVAGELYTGGDGLARGYLHRAELTSERFVANPFGEGRLYRTGDLVRWLPDGNLEFLGRIDHQIKLRGYRIELGEIEAQIAAHPSVRECVVLVREDARGDKRIVAYVVGGDADVVRAQLAIRLPDYMVPSAFVMLDALPLTPNGKIDRAALLDLRPSDERAIERLAPRTRSELEVACIFGELLRVAEVGVRDDFFALGGHSLLAIQLFAEIAARLDVSLPVSTLFRAPTVEALAAAIDGHVGATPSNLVSLRASGTKAPLVMIASGRRHGVRVPTARRGARRWSARVRIRVAGVVARGGRRRERRGHGRRICTDAARDARRRAVSSAGLVVRRVGRTRDGARVGRCGPRGRLDDLARHVRAGAGALAGRRRRARSDRRAREVRARPRLRCGRRARAARAWRGGRARMRRRSRASGGARATASRPGPPRAPRPRIRRERPRERSLCASRAGWSRRVGPGVGQRPRW